MCPVSKDNVLTFSVASYKLILPAFGCCGIGSADLKKCQQLVSNAHLCLSNINVEKPIKQ
jgi:hypothetical protein